MPKLAPSPEIVELSSQQERSEDNQVAFNDLALAGLESALKNLDSRRSHQQLTPEARQFYIDLHRKFGGDPRQERSLF
ncbi:MAG: hypothetical protein WDZ34_00860 [Candidatus Saccharimonadales bacterium]